ncbi:hypothetical protein [Streptomyces sp. 35G-GA-8]|uniref:hypothetical protein n=1 Tax=Streptomyces sp. 35G-GA-8 TaxID=2939434 RepID=UPI00201EA278|nr:hypothetical protein [Streptomyces sp. 35G-GA-8]MCL7375940.1 hypothetical protein [Streptomyces sp. 35G-GA-8]
MNSEELLGLIGEHRDSIRESLDDEQHELLLARVRALADTAQDNNRAVARALQGVRLALLQLPYDHPVQQALDSVRLVGASAGSPTVLVARELLTRLAGAPSLSPETAAIVAAVRRRLLRTPSLSAEEARARFAGAAPPLEVIRLADPERGDRYPDFQFPADDGTPHGVVLQVNRILLAETDPWGAADWWLSGNTWLGGPPASLLGALPDQQLVGAAAALVEGDG